MSEITFTKKELERYSRHLIIPEFNIDGQRKLKSAKVLVVGTGGLGSPLLLYLTAAGVGTIGILDFDVVDETNLQRQVLFSTDDVGESKAKAAKKKLEKLNPYINLVVHETKLTSANALEIIKDYDLVADGTDNFATRYLVNDACVLLGKPNVYASIFRFEGQVSVFNYTDSSGVTGPNYRDLFPSPPPPGLVPSCAEGGVIGVLPGIIGSLQANEVIKVITGVGEPLSGRLFLFDALAFETRVLKLAKDPDHVKITGLIDYDEFCGLNQTENGKASVKEITAKELKQLADNHADYQLIDVREPYEYDIVNLGGELIPMKTVEESIDKIRSDKKVVIHCRSGARSAKTIETLERKFGFSNLYNLKGGVLAWADEIDTSLPKY
jgi:sulfur-carrier protein adenylyltransferase/sulfurtransferase